MCLFPAAHTGIVKRMIERLSTRPDQLLVSERRRNMGSRAVRELVESEHPLTGDVWQDYAECAKHDPKLFFPEGTTAPARLQAEETKSVCAKCPVTAQCLEFALDSGSDFWYLGW